MNRRQTIMSCIFIGACSLVAWTSVVLAADTAPLQLRVEPGASRYQAILLLTNVSPVPVRFYLDARLASIELRGTKGRIGRCRAPQDALPRQLDERRFVVLEPGASAGERLDLRFLCFGRDLDRLEKASTLRISYRTRAAQDALGQPAWTGQLQALDYTLPPAAVPAPTSTSAPPSASPSPTPPPATATQPGPPQGSIPTDFITLRAVSPTIDVGDGNHIPVTLELRAPPGARVDVVIRPELFAFSVRGPGMSNSQVRCQLPPTGVRPLSDFLDRLGTRRQGLDLASICPSGTFSQAGVYEITPVFATTLGEAPPGQVLWTGQAEGAPFLLRVRRTSTGANNPVDIIRLGAASEQEP